MLIEEGGYQIISNLSTNPDVHVDVRGLCTAILNELKWFDEHLVEDFTKINAILKELKSYI